MEKYKKNVIDQGKKVLQDILVKDLKNQVKRICLESDYPNKKEIIEYIDKQSSYQNIQEVAQVIMLWQANQMYLESIDKMKQEEKENKPCVLQ